MIELCLSSQVEKGTEMKLLQIANSQFQSAHDECKVAAMYMTVPEFCEVSRDSLRNRT